MRASVSLIGGTSLVTAGGVVALVGRNDDDRKMRDVAVGLGVAGTALLARVKHVNWPHIPAAIRHAGSNPQAILGAAGLHQVSVAPGVSVRQVRRLAERLGGLPPNAVAALNSGDVRGYLTKGWLGGDAGFRAAAAQMPVTADGRVVAHLPGVALPKGPGYWLTPPSLRPGFARASVARHEAAHAVDVQLGWLSHTDRWVHRVMPEHNGKMLAFGDIRTDGYLHNPSEWFAESLTAYSSRAVDRLRLRVRYPETWAFHREHFPRAR